MSLVSLSCSITGPLSNLLASGGGPRGVLGLTAVASSVLLPVTQINRMYGVTIGYGGSVAAIALALRLVYPVRDSFLADALTMTTLFYGARLAIFLWCRQNLGWRPPSSSDAQAAAAATAPRWKRIPFALSLALFYAFLTTPLLYVVAQEASSDVKSGSALNAWEMVGLIMAAGGALLEAVADGHKSWVKSSARKSGTKDDVFVGPTGGVYRLCRHPNYLGEVTFWTGLTVAAVKALGKSATGWICSTLGLAGIVSLMKASTQRLVEKQEKKYVGQARFEEWKHNVPYPWIPFVKAGKKA